MIRQWSAWYSSAGPGGYRKSEPARSLHCPARLDSLFALATVPTVQSPTAPPSDSALRLAVDVRRLPWIRRLAIDYTFHFDNVASVLRRRSARTRAPGPKRRARAGASSGRAPRSPPSSPRSRSGGRRPRRARAAAARSPTPHGRRRHRPAGRPVWRPALHAAEGADRDQARRAGQPRARRAGRAGVLDRRRGSRLGRDCRAAACSTATQALARDPGRRRPTAPATARSPALTYTDEIDAAIAELERRLPHTEFTRELTRRAPPRLHAGPQHARRVRPMARGMLGPLGLVVYDASDPAAKPLAASLFARELEHAGRTTRLAVAGRQPADGRAATTRR